MKKIDRGWTKERSTETKNTGVRANTEANRYHWLTEDMNGVENTTNGRTASRNTRSDIIRDIVLLT
jgi:hypothetical protein